MQIFGYARRSADNPLCRETFSMLVDGPVLPATYCINVVVRKCELSCVLSEAPRTRKVSLTTASLTRAALESFLSIFAGCQLR